MSLVYEVSKRMISSSSSNKGYGGGRQINKALEALPKNAGFDSERDRVIELF